jgi:predicted amidohydrolase
MYTTEWSNFMRLAVAQIITGADLAANLELIREYATRAKAAGAELVVFPEAAMRAFGHRLTDIAEPVDGEWAGAVRSIAKELDITVVAGMFTPGRDGRVRNTLLSPAPAWKPPTTRSTSLTRSASPSPTPWTPEQPP